MGVVPVVVILVVGNRTRAARGQVERRVAKVIVGTNGRPQQRFDKGIVNKAVANGAAHVPRPDKIGLRCGIGRSTCRVYILTYFAAVQDLVD